MAPTKPKLWRTDQRQKCLLGLPMQLLAQHEVEGTGVNPDRVGVECSR
jgi:hypothetical protein